MLLKFKKSLDSLDRRETIYIYIILQFMIKVDYYIWYKTAGLSYIY